MAEPVFEEDDPLGEYLKERFKYDIISSSLLATSADFAPLRPGSSLGSPAFPGALGHSRGSSVAQDHEDEREADQGKQHIERHALKAPPRGSMDFRPLAGLGLVLAILSAGYQVLAVIILLCGSGVFLALNTLPPPAVEPAADGSQEEDKETPNMAALHELIVAGSAWDSVVHSTIALLEFEESAPSTSFSSSFPPIPHTSTPPSLPHSVQSVHGPTSAPPTFSPTKLSPTKLSSHVSPASLALRSALNSALSTTHTHCDSVRALLSALTLPGELAQMAEMYAPPSPASSRFLSAREFPNNNIFNHNNIFGGGHGAGRPVSLPGSKYSTPSRDRERRVKRATWDGHIGNPPNVGLSPNVTLRKRRAGRKLGEMMSLDLSPTRVEQLQGGEVKGEEDLPFGPAALGLHRTRKSSGLSQLLAPADLPPSTPPRQTTVAPATPPSILSTHAAPYTPYTPRTPYSGGNPAYGARHQLSLGALHTSLSAALASKRFACAHLLALRFDDEEISPSVSSSHLHPTHSHSRCHSRMHTSSGDREDEEEKEKEREAYWEDVRSVMSLLATTLSDTAASLGEALGEAEEARRREGNPTPRSDGYSPLPRSRPDPDVSFVVARSSDLDEDVFDAPRDMPVRLGLDMLGMVGRQGEGEADGFAPAPSRLSRFAAHVGAIQAALDGARENLDDCVAAVRDHTSSSGSEIPEIEGVRSADEDAIRAYERLRRELGFALRECERGRERLAELISTRSSSTAEDAEEGEVESVPGLAEDSDRSDKHDSVGLHTRTPTVEFHTDPLIAAPDGDLHDDNNAVPPIGIEQVYEAEPEPPVTFNRERSKLTREERIKLSKAKRGSGLGVLDSPDTDCNNNQEIERGGPGVDVVQELKDVIWQVGERRRKQAEAEL
ncbi:hypothetical protein HWV62_2565 [Athelia sp. TMB]|nr:hypothetical protein HWV62_2565 [Athelia sp. TMB]